VPLTPQGKLAVEAASQLNGALRGHHWDYLKALLGVIRAMGGKILSLERDFLVQFPFDTEGEDAA
jgi:hypothetical protein